MRPNTLTTAATYSLLALAGGVSFLLPESITLQTAQADAVEPMTTMQLVGVVRDFKERTVEGGHADFEATTPGANYCGNIAVALGSDGKPTFTGAGSKLTTPYKDSAGRKISHTLYNPALGDTPGVWGAASTGAVTSAATFAQWYNDMPGVNLSGPLSLNLERQADGSYVFDSAIDSFYAARGGFFPIDELLYGNSPGTPNHNFHFTFELHTEFTYNAAGAQSFTFAGDDDVWVFINGNLVIDLGGIHSKLEQSVDLNRLGLENGKTYPLDLFFAERKRTQSNFRIQTNLVMTSTMLPSVTMAFD